MQIALDCLERFPDFRSDDFKDCVMKRSLGAETAKTEDPEKRSMLEAASICRETAPDIESAAFKACLTQKRAAQLRRRSAAESDPDLKATLALEADCTEQFPYDSDGMRRCMTKGRSRPVESAKPVAGAPQHRDVVLAIFDVEDATKRFDASTTDQLTEYLATRVSEVAGYRVIPRDQVRSRLREEKADSYKSCFDQSCQIELGKAVAAQKSLSTKLLRIGTVCAMTSTLFDLKSETTERAMSARTECSDSALIGGIDDIVRQLNQAKD